MFLRQERYRVTTTPIAEMQLGANVSGVNPGEADDLSLGESIDPATWRKVSLTGRQSDGSLLEIELLRPLAWVDAHRIDGSDRLILYMGDLDFHGEAQLTAIDPCPPVRAGPGRTVTGLFRHHAHDVLDLYTTDGAKIGVTPNHRFWSVDRNAFISTDRLRTGETLKLRDGQTKVSRITRRATGEPVYNLEVQVSHVFHVAESGILVHNVGADCGDLADLARKKLPRFDGPKPRYHVNPQHVKGPTLVRGKTPLPADAEDVFRKAVPDDPVNPKNWFGKNADGQIYRFSGSNDGTAHFSGIDDVGDGVRNLTQYARDRLAEMAQ